MGVMFVRKSITKKAHGDANDPYTTRKPAQRFFLSLKFCVCLFAISELSFLDATELTMPKFGIVYVTPNLTIRDKPGTVGKKIGSLRNFARVIILEVGQTETLGKNTAPWYKIEFNKGTGWVFGGFITLVDFKEPNILPEPRKCNDVWKYLEGLESKYGLIKSTETYPDGFGIDFFIPNVTVEHAYSVVKACVPKLRGRKLEIQETYLGVDIKNDSRAESKEPPFETYRFKQKNNGVLFWYIAGA